MVELNDRRTGSRSPWCGSMLPARAAGPIWATVTGGCAWMPTGAASPTATMPLMATVPIPIPTRPASMRRKTMGP